MSKTDELRQELTALDGEIASLREAELTEEVLGQLAKLQAKRDVLNERLRQAVAQEEAEARADEEHKQAKGRKADLADLAKKKADIEARWGALAGRFQAVLEELPGMWQEYHALQQEAQVLAQDAATLGTEVGMIDTGGMAELSRRMQQPRALLAFEPWVRR